MDIWLNEYKKCSLKPVTYYNYYNYIKLYITLAIGKCALKNLRPDIIQKLVNEMVDNKLSSTTIINTHSLLKSALEHALNNELISKNPANKTVLPKKSRKEARVLTNEEQKEFIITAKEYMHGEVFILILVTGLRIGEALALTWNDIDFDKRMLSVNKTQVQSKECLGGNYHIKYGTPKTKSSIRRIPLIPSATQMLAELKEKQMLSDRELGIVPSINLVFHNSKGNPVRASEMRGRIERISKAMGAEGIHPHTLRHTFATRGLENGIELKIMQELLGHTNISMTADLYTHVLPDKKMESMMKLNDTIF